MAANDFEYVTNAGKLLGENTLHICSAKYVRLTAIKDVATFEVQSKAVKD